jgi:hypothetical protein
MPNVPNWKLVTPAEKAKLSPLVRHYMAKPHPFTACVRDNTKRFGPERAKRVCAVVKDIGHGGTGWRKGGKKTSAALESPDVDVLLADLAELTELAALSEKALSSGERKQLSAGAFVFPKERRYPIHDLAHARNALARASGKPEEARVKAAVYSRYPQLRKGKSQEALDAPFLAPLEG